MLVLESGRSALAIHTDRRVWKFSSLPKGEEAEAGNAPLIGITMAFTHFKSSSLRTCSPNIEP